MSEHAARSAIARMHMRVVAVAPEYADNLAADLLMLTKVDAAKEEANSLDRRVDLVASYGMPGQEQRKPFAFSGGIAIIPVHGTLINRFGSSWGFVTGYNFIRQQTAMAAQDPDVLGIVFDINSYGGEVAGCFECAADIQALANGKPTMAVVDSNAYSAGYATAVAADKIVVTPSGGAGSIGVVATHVSYEEMLANEGIKVTFIHAGKHKVDGNPYQDLSAEAKAAIQADVDASYDVFVGWVGKRRKKSEKDIRATEARTYSANEAMSLGLIDAVATPQAAVQAFLGELSGSTSSTRERKDTMSEATKPGVIQTAPDVSAAVAAALKADRARMAGIKSCEEAKGREALAEHLALNTDMSVDEAKAILAAAPKADAKATAGNPFKAAMDAGQHPNVGADADTTPGEPQNKVARLLQAARAVGVRGFDEPAKK